MNSVCIVEDAPALHGLRPEAVLESRFVQGGSGALEDISILPLYDTVGGWPVVSGRVMAPSKFSDSLDDLKPIIGVEELGISAAGEVAQRDTS